MQLQVIRVGLFSCMLLTKTELQVSSVTKNSFVYIATARIIVFRHTSDQKHNQRICESTCNQIHSGASREFYQESVIKKCFVVCSTSASCVPFLPHRFLQKVASSMTVATLGLHTAAE